MANSVVAPINHPVFSVDDVKKQADQIRDLMSAMMKVNTHYGKIPGTKNNTLLKPGADLLLFTFRISMQPHIEDLSTDDCSRYRVRAVGVHIGSGMVIGEGVGECSTNEEKYKWRAAVCQDEYNYTAESRRKALFKTRWVNGRPSGHNIIYQVRTEFADKANTVLKMAKKRAQIDLCMSALAVSDIFDKPEAPVHSQTRQQSSHSTSEYDSYIQAQQPPVAHQKPIETTSVELVGAKQVAFLETTLRNNAINPKTLCNQFRINAIDCLPLAQMNEAIKWVTNI